MNLSKNVKVTRVMNGVTAGTGDTQTGSILDMQGFDGVVFIALFGELTGAAVTKLKAQQGAAAAMGDAADLAGTELSIPPTNDNDCLILDIYKPRERYVRPVITRADANAVIDGIIAIQYGASVAPTTHDSATIALTELHVSPVEGTA
jgi:hypothetical protein